MIRFLSLIALGVFSIVTLMHSAPSYAQSGAEGGLPELPAPIQNLVSEGAQVRYLGKDNGVDGWLTVKNGQEQYFYVLPGGDAFLMGVMFNKNGKMVTVDQVRRLQQQGDGLLDTLADDEFAGMRRNDAAGAEAFDFKTPSEQLFADIESSNWIALGGAGAPVMYSFVDPQCPHCHDLIKKMKAPYLDSKKVQLRLIPVGFRPETRQQAAFLLAAPNPQERWYAHLNGDEDALPAKSELSDQGVQRNLSIMQSWELNVTPLLVYRAKDGSIKIVRGQPKDLDAVVSDLGPNNG